MKKAAASRGFMMTAAYYAVIGRPRRDRLRTT
jgi:hypothetical protein